MTEPTDADLAWMRAAISWSLRCPPLADRFNVGAIVVARGEELAYGYSREDDDTVHAEESALGKLAGHNLTGATVYTTLEPCSVRASRPLTCTQLILAAGIARVVYAIREPPFLVDCDGVEQLEAAGLIVVETPTLAAAVREANPGIPW